MHATRLERDETGHKENEEALACQAVTTKPSTRLHRRRPTSTSLTSDESPTATPPAAGAAARRPRRVHRSDGFTGNQEDGSSGPT